MATRSATSSTNSDRAVRVFVTFRIAGDDLVPAEATRLLHVCPTASHAKGETYSTGRSTVTARTGVWLFSTSGSLPGGSLQDHLGALFGALGLVGPPPVGAGKSGEGECAGSEQDSRIAGFLRAHSLTATMTLFWHGLADIARPRLPEWIGELFKAIPIGIEYDFDTEEAPSRRIEAA